MKESLEKVQSYFRKFGYVPAFVEIYTFFPIKVSKKRLKDYIDKTRRNTLGEYDDKCKYQSSKFKNSAIQMRKIQNYLNVISHFPQMKLIGLSGSVAMNSAKRDDDVDLFIITAKNRIWTARLLANIAAWALGLKRRRGVKQARNKVCLNLFFDETRTIIDKKYRSIYMTHEVLQMVPILDVNRSYRRFLLKNEWIREYCPNVDLRSYFPAHFLTNRYVAKTARAQGGILGDWFENVFKKIQLWYMGKPLGDERIEQKQLWFHPRDFQKQMKD